MKTYAVSDDLLVEVWPGAGQGDRPVVVLHSLDIERDGQAPGCVVIWPEEIRPLAAALAEAAGLLAEWAAERRNG